MSPKAHPTLVLLFGKAAVSFGALAVVLVVSISLFKTVLVAQKRVVQTAHGLISRVAMSQ